MISQISLPPIRATTGFELAAGLYMKCSSELASQLSFSPTPGNQVMGLQIIGVRNWQGVAA
jgi:hypothetical protein